MKTLYEVRSFYENYRQKHAPAYAEWDRMHTSPNTHKISKTCYITHVFLVGTPPPQKGARDLVPLIWQ